MHENSIKTYYEEVGNLSKRASDILMAMKNNPTRYWTDRQMMSFLRLPEPNSVRPRITELIKRGLAKEVGTEVCEVTGKSVRLVIATTRSEYEDNDNKQTTLGL